MLILVTGPSGIGKNFIKEAIFRQWETIKELPWTTTRPKRVGESELNRKFVSQEQFLQMKANSEFVIIQSLYGHFYGLEERVLDNNNKTLFTELHAENIIAIDSIGINPIAFGLVPSSLDFLRYRLELYRGTESQSEINLRLEAAREEIQCILYHRNFFTRIIEIDESNEDKVSDFIIDTLKFYFQRRESYEP